MTGGFNPHWGPEQQANILHPTTEPATLPSPGMEQLPGPPPPTHHPSTSHPFTTPHESVPQHSGPPSTLVATVKRWEELLKELYPHERGTQITDRAMQHALAELREE